MAMKPCISICSFGIFVCWLGMLTTALNFDFDCRRTGISCNTGKCNISDGVCDCGDLQDVNYMCQNITDFTCEPENYGNNCSLERVQVFCSGDSMFINVNPDGNFAGKIYVYGKESVEACRLKANITPPSYVDTPDGTTGLALDLSYVNADCGDVDSTQKTENGTTTTVNTRDYFIQYNPIMRSAPDQKISVKCLVSDSSTSVEGIVDQVVPGNGNFKQVDVESDMNAQIVSFKLKSTDDQPLPSTVNLGDEIMLDFAMTPGTGFVDFSLKSCKANNTIGDSSNSDYKAVTFLENDCPTQAGQALFKNGVMKSSDGPKISVSISAFMFSGSTAKIGFVCDVKLCREDNKDDCRKSICEGITSEADEKLAKELAAATTPQPPATSDQIATETSNNATETNGTASSELETPSVNETSSNATVTESSRNSTDIVENENNTNNSSSDAATNNTDSTSENQGGENNNTETNVAGGVETEIATTTAAPTGGNGESGTGPLKRRRRAADDTEPVRQVSGEVNVRDPLAPKEEVAVVTNNKHCMQQDDVITVIAVLSSTMFILFLATIAFICHIVCRRRNKKKNANHGSSFSHSYNYKETSYSNDNSINGSNSGGSNSSHVGGRRNSSVTNTSNSFNEKASNSSSTGRGSGLESGSIGFSIPRLQMSTQSKLKYRDNVSYDNNACTST